jgi:hypothetical protein
VLLGVRCPFTVARLVIAIVVFAMQGCARRTLAYVVNKGFKRVKPAIADFDSSSAIVGIGH